jgi:heme-degrading monooxygenase HmoA
MFIAMNRFQVNAGREADFETRWRERDSYLAGVPGFLHFALLRGASEGNVTEYASHTTWRSRADFDAWTQSDHFRRAHAQGSVQGILAGHPVASLYEAVLEETPAGVA